MRRRSFIPLVGASALVWACTPPSTPAAPKTSAPGAGTKEGKARLYVFNNSAPHIVEIDAETNEVSRTAELPELQSKQWNWIDANNYFDGTHLWAGFIDFDANENITARDPSAGGDSRVLLINLDTLKIAKEIDVGAEKFWLYIGKATRDGKLYVAKHIAHQMAVIDTKSHEVLRTIDVPVPASPKGGKDVFFANCDVDVSTGLDGVDRVFYPTWNGNTVVSVDAGSGRVLKEATTSDTAPVMLTAAPDGTVWVQEAKTKTNVVLDPVTLEELARFSTGGGADVTFSPGGKLGYLGGGTSLTVVDTASRRVQQTVEVGGGAGRAAAHPNGKIVYVLVAKENAVAVVDTATWQVASRIDVRGVPNGGIFLRR
jgi:YVTN family beta-propeller protein